MRRAALASRKLPIRQRLTLGSAVTASPTVPSSASTHPRAPSCLRRLRRAPRRAHEAVAGAVVSHRLVGLAGLLHQLLRLGDRHRHARVVAAVEAVHRAGDALGVGLLVGAGPVKDERRLDVLVVRGEAERLAAAPTEAGDRDLAVAGGLLGDVVHGRVQVGRHLIRRQLEDRVAHVVRAAEVAGPASLWTHTGQQIGHDGDVSGLGQLIGGQARPVGGAEDFVDDDHGRRLVLDLRVDDERLHLAVAVLDLHPLPVARGLFQPFLRPVLGGSGGGRQQQGGQAQRPSAHGNSSGRKGKDPAHPRVVILRMARTETFSRQLLGL